MSIRSFVIGLSTLLISLTAFAETHTHATAKVTFTTPDGWETKKNDEMLATKSADDAAGVLFMIVDGEKLEEAVEEAEKAAKGAVPDLKMEGEPKEAELNGMKTIFIEGAGTADGDAVEVGLAVIQTPSGKFLLALGMAKKGAHEKEIGEIFQSLKPIK